MKKLLTLGVLVASVFVAFVPAAPAVTADDEVGLVNTGNGQWHLREPDGGVRTFFFGNPGDTPLLGDWDCDGVDTPGMFRTNTGLVYLTNTNPAEGSAPVADVSFFLGGPGDRPIPGDFNGDGCDTLAIYRFGKVFIRNSLTTGPAHWVYFFGVNTDKPFAGDFNGDGVDTVGVFRTSTGLVYYTNQNPPSPENAPLIAPTANQFYFGVGSDKFFPGDWNADGTDSVGIFRPSDTTVYLRNSNTTGAADISFPFGEAEWSPVAGDFELRSASLTPDTTQLDVGAAGLRASTAAAVELSYTPGAGDAPLFITDIQISGAHPGQFAVTPPADPSIGPGETRSVGISLAPTTVGVKRAFINIFHTGVNSPLRVDFVGQAGFRVNAGGDAVAGWEADNPVYTPGGSVGPASTLTVTGPTAPSAVFEHYRFGAQAWDFPVVPGAYRVNLYFAETFPSTQFAGARRFDVAIEGEPVLSDFDIYAAAGGGYVGIDRTFDIISDANLDIDLSVLVNSPALQGIEIIPIPEWKKLGSSPDEAQFGTVAIGGTQVRTIKVVHIGEPGTAPITTQPMQLLGADADQFRFVSGAGAVTLAPGDVAEVIVEYAPNRDGAASAVLDVGHNGREAPLSVDLFGAADDVTVYRINNGGDELSGAEPWVPDELFLVPGLPRGELSTATAIDTSDPSIPTGTRVAMLRTEAFGSSTQPLSYDLPIADGPYEVRFYFVEIVADGPNQRFFDVRVEGALALNNIDVYAAAGGKFKAIMVPVQSNVTGGVLDIDFIPEAGGNLPAIHGIEVVTKLGLPVIEASPVSLTFGPVASNGVQTSEVAIVNGGEAGSPSLVIETASIVGPNQLRFELLTDLAGTAIPPGNQALTSIRFTSIGTADKFASLRLTYNSGKVFLVELTGLVNDAPILGSIPDRTVNEGTAMVSLNPAAVDPNGDTMTFSVSGLPGWATFVDNGNGTASITGTPGFTDAGVYPITVTVTDDGGLLDSDFLTITVNNVNRPPVFSQDLTARTDVEGDTISISAEATDPDGGGLLWSATGLPSGITIDSGSGLISGVLSPTAAALSPYSTAITVADGLGSTDIDTFLWTVNESFTLSVTRAGTGLGTVTSAPAGIDCGLTCEGDFVEGTFVTLTATPAVGSVFTGWSGAGCAAFGTGPCVVEMDGVKLTFATFTLETFDLTAVRAGTGAGNFTFSPPAISCGPDCMTYDFGSVVTLTPFPLAGSTFSGWSGGGCAAFGTNPCVITMTSDVVVTATFTLDTFDLTAAKAGTGSGNFTFSPTGISCGTDCMTYAVGTVVTLGPFPLAGSTFTGWSGAGCAAFGTNPCVITMDANKATTATFTLQTFGLTALKDGTGFGNFNFSPTGTSCGPDCMTYGFGTDVTLTPVPVAGSTFAGWNGAGCAAFGTNPCVLTMNSNKATTATFTLIPPVTFDLTVTSSGPGSGTVTPVPLGTPCGVGCWRYVSGAGVTVGQVAGAGSTFTAWSGDCAGGGACSVTMTGPMSVDAEFSLVTFDLTLTSSGSGSGTVTPAPLGTSCGVGCFTYPEGTLVSVSPSAGAGSTFTAWSGDCAGGGACSVTMTGPMSVDTEFTNTSPSITPFADPTAAENQTAVVDVDSTDAQETEGGGLVYSLSGDDATWFSIDAVGVVTFVAAPDFELPDDLNADNFYEVTVTVTDSGLLFDSVVFTVEVTNVAD